MAQSGGGLAGRVGAFYASLPLTTGTGASSPGTTADRAADVVDKHEDEAKNEESVVSRSGSMPSATARS